MKKRTWILAPPKQLQGQEQKRLEKKRQLQNRHHNLVIKSLREYSDREIG